MSVQSEQEEPQETVKDSPCIFGEEIIKVCPVRKDISSNKDPDITKWIKPSNKMLDEASKLVDMFTNMMSMQYNTLADFCGNCPFLQIYVGKHTTP
jgi:hypothetical protein